MSEDELRKEWLERTDHNRYRKNGQKVVFSIAPPPFHPDDDPDDMLDIHRGGSKKNGYHYAIATFSGSTFKFLWLTEAERVAMIEALGGTAQ